MNGLSYSFERFDRGLLGLATLGWTALAVLIGFGIITFHDRIVALPGGVALFVIGLLSLILGYLIPVTIARRRALWTVTGDRIEIDDAPRFGLFGRAVQGSVLFRDIARVRQADYLLNNARLEIETRDGRVFVLAPRVVSQGRSSYFDRASFDTFVSGLARAMLASGHEPPPAERMPTLWDTMLGMALLAVLSGIFALGAVFALVVVIRGNMGGLPMILLFLGLSGVFAAMLSKARRARREAA